VFALVPACVGETSATCPVLPEISHEVSSWDTGRRCFMWWNVLLYPFAVIGMIATVVCLIILSDRFISSRSSAQYHARSMLIEALQNADGLPLTDAATRLAEVRVFYRPPRNGEQAEFSVPRYLWRSEHHGLKARALVTLAKYDDLACNEGKGSGYGSSTARLSELLQRQARITQKPVFAIICELAKSNSAQATTVIEGFYS